MNKNDSIIVSFNLLNQERDIDELAERPCRWKLRERPRIGTKLEIPMARLIISSGFNQAFVTAKVNNITPCRRGKRGSVSRAIQTSRYILDVECSENNKPLRYWRSLILSSVTL